MNEKVIEKLKNPDFFKELVIMSDESKVKEAFKSSGIEISNDDLNDIKEFINVVLESSSKLSEEDLKEISGGYRGGIVNRLSAKLVDATTEDAKENVVELTSWTAIHSDQIVEGLLATAIAGISIGGTLGVQKLIKTGKEKGWWSKKK